LSRRTILRMSIVIGLGIVLAVVFVGQLPTEARPRPTAQEIEEQALAVARNEFQGDVTFIKAHKQTFGQYGARNCAWRQRIEQRFDRIPWNACDPDEVFWDVQLEGTFNWHGQVVDNLEFEFASDGTLVTRSNRGWSGSFSISSDGTAIPVPTTTLDEDDE
jgi:hypothetical protein